MNVALFGGTFDPIHCGHLSAARAARDRFALDRVYFIPTGRPPHRRGERLSSFEDRYAMVALACAGEPGFLPSLAESPSRRRVNYSIRTVRRFRGELDPSDRLFFLIGADAFLELHTWWEWRALLNSANFIIVSRPGVPLERVERVLPSGSHRADRGSEEVAECDQVREFRLGRTTAYVLSGVWEPISATGIRRRACEGGSLAGLVPPAVAEYIIRQHLYG